MRTPTVVVDVIRSAASTARFHFLEVGCLLACLLACLLGEEKNASMIIKLYFSKGVKKNAMGVKYVLIKH